MSSVASNEGPPQSLGSPAVTERIEYSGFEAHSLDRRQIFLIWATVGEFVIAHETYSMRRSSAHHLRASSRRYRKRFQG